MSNEDYKIYKTLRGADLLDGISRRDISEQLFANARQKAAYAGMTLQASHRTNGRWGIADFHYSLQSSPNKNGMRWLLNIYPGTLRLESVWSPKAPFLKLPPNWTLMDVVDAAIASTTALDTFETEIAANIKVVSNQI